MGNKKGADISKSIAYKSINYTILIQNRTKIIVIKN